MNRMIRYRRTVVAAGLALLVSLAGISCGDSPTQPTQPTEPVVGQVLVSPASGPALIVGQTRTLSVQVRSTDGADMTGQAIAWTSSATATASVSAGVVTARAPGVATVAATVGAVRGTAAVQVIAVPVASVGVLPDTATLLPGGTVQLTATARDSTGAPLAGRPVTWVSSDTVVATVSAAGLVTARRAGRAIIAAVSEGKSARATVTVLPAASSVAVAPDTATLMVGDTLALAATVRDAAGAVLTGRPVTWSSSAPSVASVDPATGVVAALMPGTAIIRATREGVSGTATVAVVPLLPIVRDVRPIAAGNRHGCGLDASGTAYCWGADGTYRDPYSPPVAQAGPVAVPGAPRFTSLAAGGSTAAFDCALDDAGAAYCWGRGTLGDGSTAGVSLTPVPVAGGLRFVSVTAGAEHACGITESGEAYCWGGNGDGRLGDGTTVTRSTPVPVAGELRFASLDAGWHHTCGVTVTRRAYCWGTNDYGQLGDGTTDGHSSPVPVVGGTDFVSISTGSDRTCALTLSGTAYCWGRVLGATFGDFQTAPTAVPGDVRFASIDLGYSHACGLTADGTAWCWGDNGGALGNGTRTSSVAPVLVSGGTTFASISAGWGFTCAMTPAQEAWCWGDNLVGQLGDYYMSSNEFSHSSVVPVLLPPPLSSGTGGPIASVSVAPVPVRFYSLNASSQLIAWPRDADGRWLLGCTMEWASTDPSIAEVDANGFVTSRGYGTAYVTATCNDVTGNTRVDVTWPPP